MTGSIVWVKTEGAELAEVELSGGMLTAKGTAIGADPLPYALEYELTTGERYVTARLVVRAHGAGWQRSLELDRGWAAGAPHGVGVGARPERAPVPATFPAALPSTFVRRDG